MTIHIPFRVANSAMSAAPTAGAAIVLLDTGNYPSFSSFLNQTWTFNGTDWVSVPVGLLAVPAAGFAILAGSGITNTGTSVVTGDVGTFPTTTETGFGSLTINGTNHAGDSVTQAAKTALTAQYTAAQALAPTATIPTELGGTTRGPGVYNSAAGTFGITGTLTLDGGGNPNATWTFQMASTLTTASSSNVVLINGAQASNVFWAVGSSATLGTSSHLEGSILALTSITATTSATVNGRLLARNGAVTLDTNTITIPVVNTLFNGAGPVPGRNDEIMAFDGTNVMLYGGFAPFNTGGVLEDTWTWDGQSWTKQSPATVPSGRYRAEAAYLSGTGVVMFGGEDVLGMKEETWVWSSAGTWTQITVANGAGPAARTGHMMAGGSGIVLLFGGQGTNGQFMDTWKYTTGGGWVQLSPTGTPSIRSDACMVYDSVNSIFVMFGGHDEYNYLDETWTFNPASSGTWTKVAVTNGPSGRKDAQMAFDTTSGKTILFGGISATVNYPSAETWAFDGSSLTWTQL